MRRARWRRHTAVKVFIWLLYGTHMCSVLTSGRLRSVSLLGADILFGPFRINVSNIEVALPSSHAAVHASVTRERVLVAVHSDILGRLLSILSLFSATSDTSMRDVNARRMSPGKYKTFQLSFTMTLIFPSLRSEAIWPTRRMTLLFTAPIPFPRAQSRE